MQENHTADSQVTERRAVYLGSRERSNFPNSDNGSINKKLRTDRH